LGLVDGGYTCGEVRDLTLRHLVSVRAKIADLSRLEETLTTISAKCEGRDTPDCPIVEALSADHCERNGLVSQYVPFGWFSSWRSVRP
jgi:hypothetical protein